MRGLQFGRSPGLSRSSVPGFIILSFVFFILSVPHSICAEEGSGADPSSSAQTREHASANREEPMESAEKEEHAEFKQSAAVRYLAKMTGLSTAGAYWVSVVTNFAIVAGLIVWFSRKKLPGAFRARTASIQRAMEEARRASEDANRRLGEIESRLSRLDSEIGEMRAAADKEAAREEERIQAATVEDMRKVVASAEQEIAAAAKSARRELTAYAADLAVSLAKKQIHVDAATDQQLLRGFARRLSAEVQEDGR
jgi:F-type H+-transporting ATPase subunit b